MPIRADHKKLHPISIRISDVQFKAISAMRNATGIPAQELIRRAIDDFLDKERVKRAALRAAR
jgi:predicted DNA binding CopG/RHH family protein